MQHCVPFISTNVPSLCSGVTIYSMRVPIPTFMPVKTLTEIGPFIFTFTQSDLCLLFSQATPYPHHPASFLQLRLELAAYELKA